MYFQIDSNNRGLEGTIAKFFLSIEFWNELFDDPT